MAAVLENIRDSLVAHRYFLGFTAYTTIVTITGASILTLIESTQPFENDPMSFIDGLYMSVSAFSCTGLASVDLSQWRTATLVAFLFIIEFGNMPILSSFPSILRLWSLRKRSRLFCNDPVMKQLHPKEVKTLKRHVHASVVIVWGVFLYWFLCHLFPFILFTIALGPWWSIFHTVTGFNNAGFALTSSNFAEPYLVTNNYVLIVMTLLMPMGNTLYPVWFRFLMSMIKRLVGRLLTMNSRPRWYLGGLSSYDFYTALKELLRTPRMYYTHLFSLRETMYLFLFWTLLTALDLSMFFPDIFHNTGIFPPGSNKFFVSLFQTVTVRTTGFSALNLVNLRQGHLAWWILAMYLSAYPFMVTERTSRGEEGDEEEEKEDSNGAATPSGAEHGNGEAGRGLVPNRDSQVALDKISYQADSQQPPPVTPTTPSTAGGEVKVQETFFQPLADLKNLQQAIGDRKEMKEKINQMKDEVKSTISRELGWLYLVILWISFYENHHLAVDPGDDQSTFLRLVFEASSAYGTVGLSLPSARRPEVSFSGTFNVASKVLILLVMFCGKLRGLPADVWDEDAGAGADLLDAIYIMHEHEEHLAMALDSQRPTELQSVEAK